MILDTLDSARLYGLGDAFVQAAEFIAGLNADTPEGEYPIRGEEIFARVMRYETKPRSEGKLEAHDRYADVQALLDGHEQAGWASRAGLTVESHDADSDVLFLTPPEGDITMVNLTPGVMALFLPGDAHMPGITPHGERQGHSVLKVVVKIEARLLDYRG